VAANGNDDKNTKQIKPTASQKNHQLCGDVDHRDRAADSVAVDGLYVIETDGGDRALPADLFPRRNQSWQLFGDYQRLSILAVCKKYVIHYRLSGLRECLIKFLHCLWVCKIGLSLPSSCLP